MPRVLSIQSHTVHGHVGNKSAVFPLQLLGFDVDFVNSVQFSNHTGYPTFKGTVLDGSELWSLIEGVFQKLRQVNPDIVYVCDPVMGDNNKLYVPEDLVTIYRNRVVPISTVLTPNQFECELLTGKQISCEGDALLALRCLHGKGPDIVVITSLENQTWPTKIENEESTSLMKSEGTSLRVRTSKRSGEECKYLTFRVTMKRFDCNFTGTGDLMAALLLAWLHKYDIKNNFTEALLSVVTTMQAVVHRTIQSSTGKSNPNPSTTPNPNNSCTENGGLFVPPELNIIRSRDDILKPPRLKYIDVSVECISNKMV
eukprot:GSMAST32.ASY1.ANO1.1627.1 assembled CDS